MGRKKKEQPVPLGQYITDECREDLKADLKQKLDDHYRNSLSQETNDCVKRGLSQLKDAKPFYQPVETPIDILYLVAVTHVPGIGGSIQIIDAKKHGCEIWLQNSGLVSIEKNGYTTYIAANAWQSCDVYPETQTGLTDTSNAAAHVSVPAPMFTTTDGGVEAAPASNAMGQNMYRARNRYM